MDEILGGLDSQITADRPRCGDGRVGGTHHGAHNLPCVLRSLDHEHHHRRAGNKGQQVLVEAFPLVLGVVLFGGGPVDGPQLRGDEPQPLALEPADDLPGETLLHRVWFADDKGSIHDSSRVACGTQPA